MVAYSQLAKYYALFGMAFSVWVVQTSFTRSMSASGQVFIAVWNLVNFGFDALLLRGIQKKNLTYVRIRVVYFLITSGIVLLLLLFTCAALLFFTNRIEDLLQESPDEKLEYLHAFSINESMFFCVLLIVALGVYTLILWMLTGLMRSFEQDQRESAAVELAQSNRMISSHSNGIDIMQKRNSEFHV